MSRLLLVDDDESFRQMLRITLEIMGYTVVEARHGHEAIKLYDQETMDVVITDLVMPGQEGLETIIQLRQKYPGVGIIAMSGGGRGSATDYLKMARALGADRVLSKPFSDDEIKVCIDQLLDKKSQSQSGSDSAERSD